MAPGGGLPIVLAFFLRDPGRKSLVEIQGEGEDVGLIHVAKFAEAGVSGFTVVELEAVLGEDVADAEKLGGGQPVLRQRARGSAENLREVDDGVARDCEGEFGLSFAGAFDADHYESAGVEDGGEGSDPGLIVVLGTEIGEHRIAEMAFH